MAWSWCGVIKVSLVRSEFRTLTCELCPQHVFGRSSLIDEDFLRKRGVERVDFFLDSQSTPRLITEMNNSNTPYVKPQAAQTL